jgi:serine/threonine-protein kinase
MLDGSAAWPPELARRLDQVCNRFEGCWRRGARPRIEDFLAEVDDTEGAALLGELVQLEVYHRRRRGEDCRATDYLGRFPELEPAWLTDILEAAGADTDASAARTPRETGAADEALAPGAPPRGRLFGDYELLEEIARGGMGVVYRARHMRLHRTVALKMILAGHLASPGEVQRFRLEAENAAGLDHAHIVPVYEVGEHDGRHYFTMKLVEGGSLTGHLARFAEDSRAAARLLATVADAVHYAHEHGILHRDLKPSNILLDSQGEPHVTDLGLARRVEGSHSPSVSGAIVGTPSYMAPEQAAGHSRRLTTAADVYALGAILYQMLAGRPPFRAETPLETLRQVESAEPVPPSQVRRGVPRDLETVCLKCLQKDPGRRYASARELAEDLRRFLADEPVLARPVGAAGRVWRWCRRKPALAGLAAALIAGVAGVASQALRADRHARDAQEQRELAEARRRKAHLAVQEYFTRVSENTLLGRSGMQELRRELLETALRYYRDFLRERPNDPAMQAEAAEAYVNVARIHDQLGAKDDARAAFEEAIALYQKLTRDDSPDRELRGRLARTQVLFGSLLVQIKALDESLLSYQAALGLQEQLALEDPGTLEWQKDTAVTHREMAAARAQQGRRPDAIAAYERGRDLLRQLVEAQPDHVDFRWELAATNVGLGNLHYTGGNMADALSSYQQARDTLRRLTDEHPLSDSYQFSLAKIHNNIAGAEARLSHADQAIHAMQQSCAGYEKLVNDNPAVADYQRQLAIGYTNLGRIYSQFQRMGEALGCIRQALPLAERLVRTDPSTPDHRQLLGSLYLDLGHVQSKLEAPAEALQAFGKALGILEQLVNDFPDRPYYRSALGFAYHNLGNELQKAGQFEKSLQRFEQGRDVVLKLTDIEPQAVEYQKLLAVLYDKIGGAHQKARRPEQARHAYRHAIDTAARLHVAHPESVDLERLLATCNGSMGVLEGEIGRAAEADSLLQKALMVRERIARAYPTLADVHSDVAATCRDLGDLWRENGWPLEAWGYYEQARNHWDRAIRANPSDLQHQGGLANTWDMIGLVLAEVGLDDDALAAHRRAIELQRSALEKAPGQVRYRENLDGHYQHLARLYRSLDRPAEAVAIALEREQLWPKDGRRLFSVACDVARCVPLEKSADLSVADQAQRGSYAELAMQVLRKAIANGYNNRQQMWNEVALQPLKARSDFADLMKEAAKLK